MLKVNDQVEVKRYKYSDAIEMIGYITFVGENLYTVLSNDGNMTVTCTREMLIDKT